MVVMAAFDREASEVRSSEVHSYSCGPCWRRVVLRDPNPVATQPSESFLREILGELAITGVEAEQANQTWPFSLA